MTVTYNRPDGKNRFQIRSAACLTLPSAWLDQEFNSIYSILNGFSVSEDVSASEWTKVDGTYTQISATSFSVAGDKTSDFEALRAIQFIDGSNNDTYSHISSASYDSGTGITTVVVYDSVVPATISKVSVGFTSSTSTALPSVHTRNITADWVVDATDQIILADDSAASTTTYDDGQVGGSSYTALWVTLPVASYFPNKLICVKKIAGGTQTIIAAASTLTITQNAQRENVYTYNYDFNILGDTAAQGRITLKGVGDCVWLVSNGTNWYELTPEASETVKGIVRFATNDEMTLTAQQIAAGDDLPKNLAVSPYNADKEYMRTDASNMRFASNYIYTAPNGVPAFIDTNIEIYKGLGLNVADGRDDNNVCKSKKVELTSNHTISDADVSSAKHLLFIDVSGGAEVMTPILAKNYYVGYSAPTVTGTQTNDKVIWFDYTQNLLRLSTDNGTNWTTFDGAGPVCEYSGNGTSITYFQAYAPLAFLTRDDLDSIRRVEVDWDSAVSISLSQMPYTFTAPGWYCSTPNTAGVGTGTLLINGVAVGVSYTYPNLSWSYGMSIFIKVKAGDVLSYTGTPGLGTSQFLPEMN